MAFVTLPLPVAEEPYVSNGLKETVGNEYLEHEFSPQSLHFVLSISLHLHLPGV